MRKIDNKVREPIMESCLETPRGHNGLGNPLPSISAFVNHLEKMVSESEKFDKITGKDILQIAKSMMQSGESFEALEEEDLVQMPNPPLECGF